jgi:uncharacterized SAM-binding protein YcdF (DUF218 family)
MAVVAVFLFTTWPRDLLQLPLVVNQTPTQADTIIVLGSGTGHRPPYIPVQARQRVRRGIELALENYAPVIIMSGGLSQKTGFIEAEKMAAFAVADGFDPTRIVMENNSTSTWTNAEFSLAIMQARGWDSAIIVTSPYHTWRACRMFHKQGANVTCLSAPYSLYPTHSIYDRLMDNRSVIREYGAIILAWLKGQL